VELVRALASDGRRVFSIEDAKELSPDMGIKSAYLSEALHHLSRTGWIVRLRRGIYAISSSVPGVAPAHEFEIATSLIQPAAVSHWSALHHHGLTDQVPRSVFVLTTTGTSLPRARRVKGEPDGGGYLIAGTTYRFVQVKPERFFGTEKIWVGEARITITDRERTLVDGLWMPEHFGDLAEVLHAFEASTNRLDLDRIIGYALRLDGAVVKRLGWVLERQGVDPARLQLLLQEPIKGYRKLDPNGPLQGPRNRRWMIQENLPGRLRA
jgi:predicted transcriptional regulator of viral defense system